MEIGGVAEGGVETAHEEEEDGEEGGGEDRDRLAPDLVGEPGAYEGTDEAEGVEDDVLFFLGRLDSGSLVRIGRGLAHDLKLGGAVCDAGIVQHSTQIV